MEMGGKKARMYNTIKTKCKSNLQAAYEKNVC